ncbi:MAG: aminotransferase class V-fold PLP-dependent enzyme [Gammaproteobacteria bacterium]|jgi:dTDP-4-amino-4,6-dideoxygalactose transaminase|nr:aminotransferase class V-fold PLP-dependent enzyme [Gammaproteobacteria bacterium]MDP6617564.1 aminotransferase class V-fold PLP-dependent enzyme [Gammaproteobacteria bacterium]MDP6694441.1 aminotransferase class V-fold PLP-dependent enzyme [Gammaproteobacteria bacterium]
MSREQIVLFKVFVSEDVLQPVNDVLMSGYIGQGSKVEEFEAILKDHVGNPNLVTLNSATSALHLAAHMAKKAVPESNWPGIRAGDEVLTSALTCTATNWPMLANDLRLKWVDTDPDTCNIDLADLESKITDRTRIVLFVHWGGYPVDLDKVAEILDRAKQRIGFRPVVIEDCAHAYGTRYKGELLGNHGNLCCFSLQAIKHFTSVDGGFLTLPNEALLRRAKLLRWYGIDRDAPKEDFRCEEDIAEWGFKFHMNDVNATIGMHNYPYIDGLVQKFKDNSAFYDRELEGVAGIMNMRRDDWADSASWIHTLKVERRDDFMRHMKDCNIMTSRVHERNDKHSCVAEFATSLPKLDKLVSEMICIPNGWWLNEEDRNYVVECIKRGW